VDWQFTMVKISIAVVQHSLPGSLRELKLQLNSLTLLGTGIGVKGGIPLSSRDWWWV